MRIILAILNLLVGLLAIAIVAGTIGWAWPQVAGLARTIGYIAMAVLVVISVIRMIRRGRARG